MSGSEGRAGDPRGQQRAHGETPLGAARGIAPGSAPTLDDVASVAGVSRATASRVLTGSPKVSDAARSAVEEAAQQLAYSPNRAARSLASRRPHSIALVVPERVEDLFGDAFLTGAVAAIVRRAAEVDYSLNLMMAPSRAEASSVLSFVRGGSVGGALVISHHVGDQFLSALADSVAVVFGGTPPEGVRAVGYVDVDNREGGRLAGEHLAERGATRVAVIEGPADMRPTRERRAGLREALRDAAVGVGPVASGGFRRAGGSAAMREILATGEPFDAVFAQNDLMALGAMDVLVEHGLDVPGDVRLMGFDDIAEAATAAVPLSTVRQPIADYGAAIVDLLVEHLDNGAVASPQVRLPLTLVPRSST